MVAIRSERPFLPEALTPLFHTAAHAGLTPHQRLRYNQLHGLYVNEQILFFEESLAEPVLGGLLGMPLPDGLDGALRRFREDEAAHSIMFRELNRQLAPDLYADGDFHFIPASRAGRRVLGAIGRHPRWFPLLLWLMLMLEERSLHYGREILRDASTLEPRVIETQTRHLRDEAHHVRWDQEVLDWLWPRTERPLRRLNAALFTWLVGEFFSVPRRGSLAVIQELARQCPELQARRPELAGELRALSGRRAFHASLYSRRIAPQTFGRFDRWPEFARVGRVLGAYAPPEPAG
ncbi:MAG: diiron oxygenase [Candidatus Rokuibacteriota bacterium]